MIFVVVRPADCSLYRVHRQNESKNVMAVLLVRPDVAHLVLSTYGRALHPELFEHHSGLTISNSQMQLDVRLNACGHLLMLKMGRESVTEVIADHRDLLPERSRIFNHRLRGTRTESAEFDTGLRYDMSCQLERLEIDIFLRMNEELEHDCRRADLSARLPAINRFLPGPLSLIRAEVTRDSLLIYAFHTFPEHCAIVKTQSLFERTDR